MDPRKGRFLALSPPIRCLPEPRRYGQRVWFRLVSQNENTRLRASNAELQVGMREARAQQQLLLAQPCAVPYWRDRAAAGARCHPTDRKGRRRDPIQSALSPRVAAWLSRFCASRPLHRCAAALRHKPRRVCRSPPILATAPLRCCVHKAWQSCGGERGASPPPTNFRGYFLRPPQCVVATVDSGQLGRGRPGECCRSMKPHSLNTGCQ